MELNNTLKLILVAGLFMSGATVAGVAESVPAPVFTPAQEARIGEVANEYLLAHPEILLQVSQKLQVQQEEQQIKAITAEVLKHQEELLDDKSTPSYGPADAKVALVEFFDYQCIFCARQAPVLKQVMETNPQVRYVFKEWPVFGGRWPASLEAAKTGLQIWRQKGAEAYLSYHNGLFATGHHEGKLTENDIRTLAGDKLNKENVPGEQRSLDNINSLAQSLGLGGTPVLIVMPAKGATVDNVTVIPGSAGKEKLQAAINKADVTK